MSETTASSRVSDGHQKIEKLWSHAFPPRSSTRACRLTSARDYCHSAFSIFAGVENVAM